MVWFPVQKSNGHVYIYIYKKLINKCKKGQTHLTIISILISFHDQHMSSFPVYMHIMALSNTLHNYQGMRRKTHHHNISKSSPFQKRRSCLDFLKSHRENRNLKKNVKQKLQHRSKLARAKQRVLGRSQVLEGETAWRFNLFTKNNSTVIIVASQHLLRGRPQLFYEPRLVGEPPTPAMYFNFFNTEFHCSGSIYKYATIKWVKW